jgi:hypothetical protein
MTRKAKSAGSVQPSARPRSRLRFATAVEVVPAGVLLIRRFTEAVQSGSVPAPDVLQDLATRLQQILDGTEPKKALDLVRGKGVKRTAKQQFKEQEIAWDVADLYEQRGRGTLPNVYESVGNKHNRSSSAVKKIYLEQRRQRPEWFVRKKIKK